MNKKLKQIITSFALMALFYLAYDYLSILWDFGIFVPHVGILYISGLLFGPFGALGAVLCNAFFDGLSGYNPIEILASETISFGVSILAYKLWYSKLREHKITQPKLNNTYHLGIFLISIFICGFIYSEAHTLLINIIYEIDRGYILGLEYLINFINVAFVFGIINIWLSKKIDYVYLPRKSKRKANKTLYRIIFICLMIATIIPIFNPIKSPTVYGIEFVVIGVLLIAYITKPIEYDADYDNSVTTLEKIINISLIITLVIAILGIMMSFVGYSNKFINVDILEEYIPTMPLLIIADAVITLFLIPCFEMLRYIEKRVTKPISSFSEIEDFIREDERIEAEGLLEVYSEYTEENDEIGKLARSYTNLIKHNNHYIDNIQLIEGEKKRIQAELEIAKRIQASNLPTAPIETEDFIINGYSHPAKEVGGDFFDYYMIDEENLALIIGDASGKGIPAAILAMKTQVLIKQLLNHEEDPSKVLYLLNNQLCEHNSEAMFIALWLGIYNKNTEKLTFSNAGHTYPIIKENNEFKYLKIDSGLLLGVFEDYEFLDEEIELSEGIFLYTDGITDANNKDLEMYGTERLLNFFKEFDDEEEPIAPLLNDIHKFSEDQEQFDDMTLIYLKNLKNKIIEN